MTTITTADVELELENSSEAKELAARCVELERRISSMRRKLNALLDEGYDDESYGAWDYACTLLDTAIEDAEKEYDYVLRRGTLLGW